MGLVEALSDAILTPSAIGALAVTLFMVCYSFAYTHASLSNYVHKLTVMVLMVAVLCGPIYD